VEKQEIHGLQAKLAEAGLQAEAAVGGTEISGHHAAAVHTPGQGPQAWGQLQQPSQPTLALGGC
jgi:hypothetical protein